MFGIPFREPVLTEFPMESLPSDRKRFAAIATESSHRRIRRIRNEIEPFVILLADEIVFGLHIVPTVILRQEHGTPLREESHQGFEESADGLFPRNQAAL